MAKMKEKYILNGHETTITIPDNGANGNWVWRAEFPDDFNYYEENRDLLYKAYKEKNAPIKLIVKPDYGHHPHSLSDPTEIVDFIINAHK